MLYTRWADPPLSLDLVNGSVQVDIREVVYAPVEDRRGPEYPAAAEEVSRLGLDVPLRRVPRPDPGAAVVELGALLSGGAPQAPGLAALEWSAPV